MQLLVDSSVWIDLLKDYTTLQSSFLEENFDAFEIVTCPTIIQEVLQGLNSNQEFNQIKTYFEGITRLNDDPYNMALKAALLYKNLRKAGKTIRKPNDCLIAVYAIENVVPLLHSDKDFDFIAEASDLLILEIS